ncbi:amino acid ABC transporter [Paenibacillus sp. CAA11]|uniref:transporter substrate-binding domain-containing protein n=1 Tax=Paenibacillus sp. CAA11 TaxID=1532905 RepID=UPI000D396556|nr:transporter substrate-binding domain-containing protein [Paenibacillus sp. CAA11]AWB44826.1 amino acid ABC transporter [Paenibacillus sp. CAA11]
MKKWGILLVCMVMTASLLAACGQNKNNKESASGNDQASGNTGSKKTLIVGMSADFPPYEFKKTENGKVEIVGFDVDIAKEIAKDAGAELEIKDMTFSSLLNELDSGRIDMVISGLSPTPDRAKQVGLSNIYYKAEQAVVVREGDKAKFSTLKSLENASIGVQTGSIQEGIAKEIKGAKLTSLPKINDIIMQLNSGRVDAAIIEGPVAESFVKNVKGISIADAKPVTEDEGYVVGVKKDNTELLNQVNTTLDRLKKDNLIDQFVQKASTLAEE